MLSPTFDLQPMSTGDILDRTIRLYRRHFLHTLAIVRKSRDGRDCERKNRRRRARGRPIAAPLPHGAQAIARHRETSGDEGVYFHGPAKADRCVRQRCCVVAR